MNWNRHVKYFNKSWKKFSALKLLHKSKNYWNVLKTYSFQQLLPIWSIICFILFQLKNFVTFQFVRKDFKNQSYNINDIEANILHFKMDLNLKKIWHSILKTNEWCSNISFSYFKHFKPDNYSEYLTFEITKIIDMCLKNVTF